MQELGGEQPFGTVLSSNPSCQVHERDYSMERGDTWEQNAGKDVVYVVDEACVSSCDQKRCQGKYSCNSVFGGNNCHKCGRDCLYDRNAWSTWGTCILPPSNDGRMEVIDQAEKRDDG